MSNKENTSIRINAKTDTTSFPNNTIIKEFITPSPK